MRNGRSFDPYTAALGWLAGRELTSGQIATRLRQRGCTREMIEATLTRLRSAGALDDLRAAAAFARMAVEVKRYGPRRVALELKRRGLDPDTVNTTVEQVFAAFDETELIERALARRLRGTVKTPAEFRRLHAYLLRHGFSSSAATAVLRARSKSASVADP
jgi:regulatory protein